MDMARFDAEVAQIHRLLPALSSAVPPAPAVREWGSHSVCAEESFKAIDPRTFRLRAPTTSPAGLVGPFRGHGDCLVPLFGQGDLKWFDPTLPAEDGDIVLVQWHPRTLQGIVKRGCRDAAWLALYGEQPSPLAVKVLRHFAGEHYLLTRESLLRLGRNRILGVLRYAVDPDGVPLYGCGGQPIAHQIGANAATLVLEQVIASGTIARGGTYTTLISQSLTGPLTAIYSGVSSLSVICTAVGTWEYDTGTSSDSGILSLSVNQFPGTPNNRVMYRTPTATVDAPSTVRTGSFSIEEAFSLAPGTSATFVLSGISTLSASTSTFKVLDAILKTEIIAR